jgi:gas vesicle protein GvpG
MGLLTGLVTLPLAPLRGVVAVAEQVRRQAEEAYYDPAAIRAELDDVEAQRASGQLSDEEATMREDELIDRLMAGQQLREERHG